MATPLQLERERRGLTQQQVADSVLMNRSYYSRIERAEVGASRDLAKRISAFFDGAITRDEILYPEDYPTPTATPTPTAKNEAA